MTLWQYVADNPGEVLRLTGQHVYMVAVAVIVAALVGVPAGIATTRHAWARKSILGFANVVQTIPSLALFGFLIPIPIIGGIGAGTAIIALFLYALLPIVRNTNAGISGVDPAVIEAGRGMGLTSRQLLWNVELPIASPVILSGIRVAAITAVGVATIAAAIGAGGLGEYIFRGVASVNSTLILAGAIPAALLALIADVALGWIERNISPSPRSSH